MDQRIRPPEPLTLADGSSRMSKSVSSIDKSTLSVSPLFVIEAHSEKKETVVVGAGKVSEFVVVGAGSSGSVGNRRLLDAGHSVVRAPSRRTTRRVDRG